MAELVEEKKEELKKKLSEQQYYVCVQKGTERPFTGEYWDSKEEGVFQCVVCDNELFESDTKFKSGTGWPSFWEPIEEGSVRYEKDFSIGVRTEVLCGECGAHLGHVFDDGPEPTGKRYCVNSAALKLEKRE